MTISDIVQLIGALLIFAGYWLMPRSVKTSSFYLVLGCAVWAAWTLLIHPWPWGMFGLETILGALSARTYFKS